MASEPGSTFDTRPSCIQSFSRLRIPAFSGQLVLDRGSDRGISTTVQSIKRPKESRIQRALGQNSDFILLSHVRPWVSQYCLVPAGLQECNLACQSLRNLIFQVAMFYTSWQAGRPGVPSPSFSAPSFVIEVSFYLEQTLGLATWTFPCHSKTSPGKKGPCSIQRLLPFALSS